MGRTRSAASRVVAASYQSYAEAALGILSLLFRADEEQQEAREARGAATRRRVELPHFYDLEVRSIRLLSLKPLLVVFLVVLRRGAALLALAAAARLGEPIAQLGPPG